MKKYRLKADIPGHKAGEIFERGDSGMMYDAEGSVTYTASELHRRPGIMDWFKEVGNGWVPRDGEDYWGIDDTGKVYRFTNYHQDITDNHLAIDNCYRTEGEAEKRLEWLRAVAVLSADTANQHPSWGDDEWNKYQVYYNYQKGKLLVDCWYDGVNSPFSFDNESDARRSITEHKAEWLTFLGIEQGGFVD